MMCDNYILPCNELTLCVSSGSFHAQERGAKRELRESTQHDGTWPERYWDARRSGAAPRRYCAGQPK